MPLPEGILVAQAGGLLPGPSQKWELWDKEKFLEVGKPTEIPEPADRNNFASAQEVDNYLAESKARVDIGRDIMGYKELDEAFAQSVVDAFKGNPRFPHQAIKDPGDKPENILKAARDFVALNFKGHAEKNYYLRFLFLDGKRFVNLSSGSSFNIVISPEAKKILIDRSREIENILYASYKNIARRLAEAEGDDRRLWVAYLVFITGEADSKRALDKFLQGPGRYLHFSEGETGGKNAEIIAHAAKDQIARKWFKSVPPPVVAKAEATPKIEPPSPPPPAVLPPAVLPPPAQPPAPPKPAIEAPTLAAQVAPPAESPSIYALIPQNQGKEILIRQCRIEGTPLKAPDKVSAYYYCPIGAKRFFISAQTFLDKTAWTPWRYDLNENPASLFSARTAADKSLAVTLDATGSLKGIPYENDLELEETIARFLQPSTPLPEGITLSVLTESNYRKNMAKNTCKPAGLQYPKEDNHVQGVANTFDCKVYDNFKPQLFTPLLSRDQADGKLFHLGNWSWRFPTPNGLGPLRPVNPGRQIGLTTDYKEAPFEYGSDEELFGQLTRRIFPQPHLESTTPRHGEDYGRSFSSFSACRFGPITVENGTVENGTQNVDGQCSSNTGQTTDIRLRRNVAIEAQGEERVYRVDNWDLIHGNQVVTLDPDRPVVTVIPDRQGVRVIQSSDERERVVEMDRHYRKNLGERYFPKVLVLRGALSYVSGNLSASVLPSAGSTRSEESITFHSEASAGSELNSSGNEGNGYLFNLEGQLFLGGALGAGVGGPFLVGSIAGGHAGDYHDRSLNLVEGDFGAGISLREIFGWRALFDLSVRALFLRRTFYSSNNDLFPTERLKSPLFGACLTIGHVNACLDTSHDTIENSDLNLARFSLGYDFFSAESRPHVEIGE